MREVRVAAATIATLALSLGVGSGTSYGQDADKVSPQSVKVLFENDRVKVVEVTLNPSDSLLPHSHPDNFAYTLGDAKLRVNYIGKESVDFDAKGGQIIWSDAEPLHTTVNSETKVAHWIEVELKEPRAKKTPDPKDVKK